MGGRRRDGFALFSPLFKSQYGYNQKFGVCPFANFLFPTFVPWLSWFWIYPFVFVRYECQWEDDKAMDSTAEGARSIHFRADGFECTGDCDVRCKEKGGDELRRLMRRINEQRMMVGAGVGCVGVRGGGSGVVGGWLVGGGVGACMAFARDERRVLVLSGPWCGCW